MYLTVLCGQLLCFFKDHEDFLESKAAASPLSLHEAECEPANDYTKRKNVFRLVTKDKSEFLFAAENAQHLDEWVKKISFHAHLLPKEQLTKYDPLKVVHSLVNTSATYYLLNIWYSRWAITFNCMPPLLGS